MTALIYFAFPFFTALIVQMCLCFLVKHRLLRHSTLILFPLLLITALVSYLTAENGAYQMGSSMSALLWVLGALCSLWGYGMAWGFYGLVRIALLMKQNRGGEKP